MKLTGLHILLTYQCTFECEHCFVWGSPWQSGTFQFHQIKDILAQAKRIESLSSIFFEGGEPFLYYGIMVEGAKLAKEMGFHVGVVSNAYWANSVEDAVLWLKPLAGVIEDLSISNDLFHYDKPTIQKVENAVAAAQQLCVPVGLISIARPEETSAVPAAKKLENNGSTVMFRGRAACTLVQRVSRKPWKTFARCPHEDLREPGRVHLDPLGNIHVCQGITLGNIFEVSLSEVCSRYDADAHPICGPLLAGGPAALIREYDLPHTETYADACHLCYEARLALRGRFPTILGPDQMYGVGL